MVSAGFLLHHVFMRIKPIVKDAAVATDALIKSISIPSRPGTLLQLQTEISTDDPDVDLIASLVASDLALTVATLRVVNSPVFALPRSCETVDKAIAMLGLQQLNVIVTGLVLRNVLRGDARQLAQFWDMSGKRAYAMSQLARSLGLVDVPVAQLFGLFCDVGIPLLMQRFTDYEQTLAECHNERLRCFTAPEQDRHNTDHALIGAMMARSWGLSPTLCLAIQRHHDYSAFSDPKVPETVSRLMAMGLVAEAAIQRFAGQTDSAEWEKGGDHATGALVLNVQDSEDWIDRLFHDFANGLA